MKTYGVIMAGGSGTRFWPLSRQSRPKQLLTICGKEPMINQTIDRLEGLVASEDIYIVTNDAQAERTVAVTRGRVLPEHVLVEPAARNTAACIALAAAHIAHAGGDGVMCVFPADHYIRDVAALRSVLNEAVAKALAGDTLVTIGIQPTYPATGYGYIRCGQPEGAGSARRVLAFREKPDPATAEEYLLSGEYVWNSGIFVWRASVILEQFRALLPDIYADIMEISAALGTGAEDAVMQAVYPRIRRISVDYGILEKSGSVCVIPGDFGWSDIGTWASLDSVYPADERGNIRVGDANCVQTSGSVVYAASRHVSVVGMEDVVVVETPDAVLVTRRSAAQDVRLAVDALAEQGRKELL